MTDTDIAAHALAFRSHLTPILTSNVETVISNSSEKLDQAYARLTCLQAWRSSILESSLPVSSLGFYSEAQNDGLTSIALVTTGLWRPALKSLRSVIENILHCLYYMDHPIEYRHWESGIHRPTFQKLFEYFESHPDLSKLPASLQAVGSLKSHYSHLSNAVHSSAKDLRMTDDLNPSNLWKTSSSSIGKWAATQKNVLRDVNLLMLPLFSSSLQGAAHKGLRESLCIVFPVSKDTVIKTELGVRLVRS